MELIKNFLQNLISNLIKHLWDQLGVGTKVANTTTFVDFGMAFHSLVFRF